MTAPHAGVDLSPRHRGGAHLVTPGVRVTDAAPSPAKYGYGLDLAFGDGGAVAVVPTPPEPGDDAVADGEVLTPAGRLTAGPGRRWEWAPATKP